MYQVRNRYYHAGLGRWGSRDSVGYADGVNIYAYAGGSPVALLDAMGQAAQSVDEIDRIARRVAKNLEGSRFDAFIVSRDGGPEAGHCGSFIWIKTLGLNKPSVTGGTIIQQVDTQIEMEDCNGNKISPKGSPPSVFWETWRVNPGSYEPVAKDYWRAPVQKCTRGRIRLEGRIKFYEGLSTLPPSFVSGNPRVNGVTVAPASTTPPALGNGSSNEALTVLEAIWDCCPPQSADSPTQFEHIE